MATTILTLAANPTETAQLRLAEEVREIQEGLNKAKYRDEFELKQQWAVRPRDVQDALLQNAPNIIHFCGHGGGSEGIIFEDDQGNAKLVQTTALTNLFQLFSDDIQCVVLNACYSEVQARAIAQHIPYVIGMNKAIGDKAAIEFALAFYKGIGAGKDIEFAYKLGCNAIEMAGIPEQFTPVLKRKNQNLNSNQNQSTAPSHNETPQQNTVNLFNAKTDHPVDGYVINRVQQTLSDNGYTPEFIENTKVRSLAVVKANKQNPPSIVFNSEATLNSHLKNNLTNKELQTTLLQSKQQSNIIWIQIGESEEQIELPTELPTEKHKKIIWNTPADDAALSHQLIDYLQNPNQQLAPPQQPEEERTPPAPTIESKNTPDLWLTFHLEQENGQVIAHWLQNDTNYQHKTPAKSLLGTTINPDALSTALSTALLGDSESWQQKLQPQLKEKGITHWHDAKIRIRIMTDDHQLTILPWHTMETGYDTHRVIEVSPVSIGYQQGFTQQALNTPLVVIPAKQDYNLGADTHYRLIEEYLQSYLEIHGSIPRVYKPSQLQREIDFQQPDIIYIYAKYENGTILLDDDYNSEPLTLNTLGTWLEEATIRPIVVLSLIGQEIHTYPEKLVKNCHLLWVQQSRRLSRLKDLSDNLADIFTGLNENTDITKIIQQADNHSNYDLYNRLWINGRSLEIDINDTENARSRQLRAALLRIMLGREDLKNNLYGQIHRSDVINSSTFMVYAVTGNRMACPFDFPAQLQQRLQFVDENHFLQVIPYYFHVEIEPHRDAFDTIDIALGQGILHGNPDIRENLQQELERRGLVNEECCISLNWQFNVSAEHQHLLQDLLQEWLNVWTEILCSDFSKNIPDSTVLLSAACIQVNDSENEQDIQRIQDLANKTLRKVQHCLLHHIHIDLALGKLRAFEVANFLGNNHYWRKQLKLDQQGIDIYNYADWIYEQNSGDFDSTVRKIWQQYKNNYEEYLQDSQEN